MNKTIVDDAASDSTKPAEEQVDRIFREALERFQKIYGKGAADGLPGAGARRLGSHSK